MEDILVPLGAFAMVVLVVWFSIRSHQVRFQAKADLHRQLLDKFTSGSELSQFLESESSKWLVENLSSRKDNAKERILRSVKVGVILSALGLGFTVLTWWDADSIYHGVILLSLGGGFLLAAAISHRLSTKWGLLSSQEEAAREQRSPT